MSMRSAILGVSLLALAACGDTGNRFLERGVAITTGEQAPPALPAGQFPPRFSALVADTSVPALILTVENRGQTGRLLRENTTNGVETWISSDLTAIMLQDGMLQGTRALGSEFFAADLAEPLALVQSGRSGYSDRLHSNLDGNDEISTRSYRCLVENEGSSVISLEIGTISTRVMTEDCKSLDQSFRNTYWVDTRSGAIVQTRQWADEALGYVKTQAASRQPTATAPAQEVVLTE